MKPTARASSIALVLVASAACGTSGQVRGGGAPEDASAGQAASDGGGGLAETGAQCLIQATSYDESCSTDSDCTAVADNFGIVFGDYCSPMCLCANGVISTSSVAQYVKDVASTPLGSGAIGQEGCSCGTGAPSCCVHQRCTHVCPTVITIHDDAGASDAGAVPDGSVMCALDSGPVDAGSDSGAWRWCLPNQSCVPFNGAWACCLISASVTVCSPPQDPDAGG